jgi:serine/threonine protein phosphatase PrpC
MFVYDSLTFSKFACRDIFAVDEAGEARTTGQGSYFKNVRNEWATLLTTPPHARYPDALAFTRSLGDFHLATWGVSCEPDVWTIDLADSKTEASTGRPLALCLCSDGVWDNWKYPDVSAFLCKDEYTELARTEEGAQSIANTFMAANLKEALSNFGAQADNMTAVLAYFHE